MFFAQDSLHSWVVVVGCFTVYFSNFGIYRVSGLLFTGSLQYYGSDRESTSLPFVLSSGIRGVSCLLGGYLSYKIGYQKVVMLGSILSSIGIGSIFFANDIRIVAVSWSIYGVGCGLATCLLPQIINLCFTKHGTKANGIALAGPSVAGIIWPLFTVPLLEKYSIPGTYLNLGAVLLHSVFGTLLLKTPDSNSSTNKIIDKSPSYHQKTKVTNIVPEENCHGSGSCNKFRQHTKSLEDLDRKHNFQFENEHVLTSGYLIPNPQLINCVTSKSEGSLYENVLAKQSVEKGSEEILPLHYETEFAESLNIERNIFEHSRKVLGYEESKNILSTADNKVSMIIPGTIYKGEVPKKQLTQITFSNSGNIADLQDTRTPNHCIHICSVLWDPVFLIIAISISFITTLCIIVPAVMTDIANDKGIPSHHWPHLLIVYSISDLFAKLAFGWIIDCNYMPRSRYMALWFCVLALAFGLMLWSKGFVLMAVTVGLIGMVIGSVAPAQPGLVAQFIEKEKRAMAMASTNVFFIPLCLSMAPLIGYFRDEVGSYNGLLCILVTVSLLCGVLVLILPTISSCKEERLVSNIEH